MSEIHAWVVAHHGLVVEIGGGSLAALNLTIKLLLWMHPLTDWVSIAEKKPRVAALVRLMGALGIQPVALLQALIDFIRGKASPGTMADAKAFQVSASKPLIAKPSSVPPPK